MYLHDLLLWGFAIQHYSVASVATSDKVVALCVAAVIPTPQILKAKR